MRTADQPTRKVARARPDAVVLGGDDPPLAAELLAEPCLKVLALAEEGRLALQLNPAHTAGALDRPARRDRQERSGRSAGGWWNR
jgi:hypothetical protein